MRMYYFHSISFKYTERNADHTQGCLSREWLASNFVRTVYLFSRVFLATEKLFKNVSSP